MTYRELYLLGKQRLSAPGIDVPQSEAALLCAHFLGMERRDLILSGDQPAPPAEEKAFLQALEERRSGRPLQYILGQWKFLDVTLFVGEGALIPREDTGVLVNALSQALEGVPHPVGADLCAGTGAVGLGLCSMRPEASVSCVELSPEALVYLEKNIHAHPQFQVELCPGDVLRESTVEQFSPDSLDFIASNPPYIESPVIPTLQREVLQEPALALDGGQDGLLFYRELPRLWLSRLRTGGLFAVEIGETQAPAVTAIFQQAGLEAIEIHKDFQSLPRTVIGRKKK